MTAQVSTQDEQAEHGRWTPLVMTALTLAVLGAAALWQFRPGGDEAAAPAAVGTTPSSMTTAETTDGVIPLGGLAERYQEELRAGVDGAAPPFGEVAWTDGAGHYRAEHEMAPRDGEQTATAVGLELVVATDEEAAAVYGQLIERFRTLDGTTPVAVTVVVDGAAATTAPSVYGVCDATIGPAGC